MSLLLLLSQSDPATADAITPSVAEVAALLRARTYVDGVEVGTFNTETRPNTDQVEELVDFALNDLLARIGIDIPEQWKGEARRLAALQTASLIEASYFPEQLDTDQSAYRQYSAMFLAGVDRLVALTRRSGSVPVGSIFTSDTTQPTYFDLSLQDRIVP